MDYPKMLYKWPGPYEIHGGKYDYTIVHGSSEEGDRKADGWRDTTTEAYDHAHRFYPMGGDSANDSIKIADDAPPSRQEMETQAKSLGLKFDGRTPDRKLLSMIEAAMKD